MSKTWKIVWTVVGIAAVAVIAYYLSYWIMSGF